MRVAYLGNFDVSHSTESHIAQAWENIGHSVTRIPEQRCEWATLPAVVEGHDLFLWTRTAGFDPPHKDEVQPQALSKIRCPKVGYHLDRWWGLDREWWIDDSAFFTDTDFICTADGGHDDDWARKGITHYWFPPAILEAETVLGTPDRRYTADVVFVGNLTDYGHAEWAPYRQALHVFLRERYHGRFQVFPGRGRPQIRGRDLANLYATVKVVVGDSCLVGEPARYWSDRIPETMGRGGYLIHPHVEGLLDVHPKLDTYPLGDFDRLGVKIDLALSQPGYRTRNAAANREQILAGHTYETRMKRLASLLT